MSSQNLEHNYLTIPPRLLNDLQDTPLAVGLYSLVARLYLIEQRAIPLSASDVTRIDSSISYGAARRAIQRLVECGWVIEHDGRKHAYVPTWGRTRTGENRPWQIGLSMLGCPKHVAAVRIDRRLIDVCIGRIEPHAQHPLRRTDSYLTRPLIGLRDVGAYALATAGFLTSTACLEKYGFISNGQAQPLPGDAALLAVLSQLHLADDQTDQELTTKGLRKLGVTPQQQTQTPDSETPPPQPLFFVPPGLIGNLIGHVIGQPITKSAEEEQALSVAASQETEIDEEVSTMTGNPGNIRHSRDSTPLTPPIAGGGVEVEENRKSEEDEQQSETESARLLRAINVKPTSVHKYANLDSAIVQAAIAHAQSRPGVKDVAAWTISLLRDHVNDGWRIPQTNAASGGWTPEYIAELKTKYPGLACNDLDLVSKQSADTQEYTSSPDPHTQSTDKAPSLTDQVREELHLRLHRKHWSLLNDIEVFRNDDALVLVCRTLQVRESVVALVAPVMSNILEDLALPGSLQIHTVVRSVIV